MLEHEWGNPSTIMLTGDENVQESDQNRQIFYPYAAAQTYTESPSFIHNPGAHFAAPHHQQSHLFGGHEPASNTHLSSLYDPRGYGSYAVAGHVSQASLLSLESAGAAGFMMIPKSEPVAAGFDFSSSGGGASRIGLNLGLGGRTYFASSEDDFVNRLYRRSRGVEAGSVNSPRCQAEGCSADLAHAKHYHRRHKVCEFHSKTATVIVAGLTQRFCQQCSRFHLLSEFDNGKRSCRKRLADHNRRRRKSQQSNPENANKSQLDNARNSSSESLARSPSDSGAQTSSSVTIAVSPPRINSVDGLIGQQRSLYQATPSVASTASTTSLFYSNQ